MLVFINYWIEKCTVKHWNSIEKIQISLKSDKNNGRFTWRHMSEKCFRQSFRDNKSTLLIFSRFPPKSYPLWNNVQNYCSTRLTTGDNIMLPRKGAICVSHIKDKNTDTHPIFNSYFFYTVIMVTRMRLNIAL